MDDFFKTDGVVGPKTRRALRFAATNLGRPKIEEGFALGRFGRFARGVQDGRADTRKLGTTIDKAFGPLFHPLGTAFPKAGRAENAAFQATLNDLGPKVFEWDAFKPIREDGLIGPRTETAFNAVLPAIGPDRFTSRLGHNLGFFDFDDLGERIAPVVYSAASWRLRMMAMISAAAIGMLVPGP